MARYRFVRAIGGLPAVVAAAAVAILTAPPAVGRPSPPPPPASSPDALAAYQALGEQAGQADEALLQAQNDLKAKQGELDGANAALAQAARAEAQSRTQQEEARSKADVLVTAAYQGGVQPNQLSALLAAGSPQDFLDRSALLTMVAAQNKEVLDQLAATLVQVDQAKARAQDAQQRTQAAKNAANAVTVLAQQRKKDLDARIAQLRAVMSTLTPAVKRTLATVADTGSYAGPPGAANEALQAALSRRGSDYVWAAAGPSTFDCSGLTMWAFNKAGISLPHSSRAQYGYGRPVSPGALQPGDLLFYGDAGGDPATIHHVGMYVGNGRMVDAPTEGQVVDVRPVRGDGHFLGARRIAG